jgi:predicted N-acetyltransferase YhbS
MEKTWKLALFQDEDMEGLVELCQLQAGKAGVITAEYIDWQLNKNPAGQAQVAVAKETTTDKILGVVWFMPLRVQIENEIVPGSQSLYALVLPDYRRQGILSGMAPICHERLRQQGVKFSYGFPNPNSYHPYVKRFGWVDIGDAYLYLRPLNVKRLIAQRLGHGFFQWSLGTAGQAAKETIFRPKSLRNIINQFSISEVHTLDPLLNDFWQRVKGKYPVMLVRDTTFLDWRYTQIPNRSYIFIAAKHRSSIVAYIVLRKVIIEGIHCGMVVDFLVEPTSEGRQAGRALLQKALYRFELEDLDLAGCLMLPGVEETKLLVNQGFVKCPTWLLPQPFPILLQVDEDAPKKHLLNDLSSWFLTMGDYDAV